MNSAKKRHLAIVAVFATLAICFGAASMYFNYTLVLGVPSLWFALLTVYFAVRNPKPRPAKRTHAMNRHMENAAVMAVAIVAGVLIRGGNRVRLDHARNDGIRVLLHQLRVSVLEDSSGAQERTRPNQHPEAHVNPVKEASIIAAVAMMLGLVLFIAAGVFDSHTLLYMGAAYIVGGIANLVWTYANTVSVSRKKAPQRNSPTQP